jgi:hypothetical protein
LSIPYQLATPNARNFDDRGFHPLEGSRYDHRFYSLPCWTPGRFLASLKNRLRNVTHSQVCRADSQIDEAPRLNQTKPTEQGTHCGSTRLREKASGNTPNQASPGFRVDQGFA